MAKEKSPEAAGVQTQKETPPKKPRFRDTWQGFLLFVAILLALRFLVFEPFKIPTGSMEPTLIGHEDYGDRIVTNKIAYSGGTNPIGFLGGDPKRFEVFVFVHDSKWQDPEKPSLQRNYIKRCVGLPGESIVISGGDLFLLKDGKETILRKWEASKAMQESLWQPVSVADLNRIVEPETAAPAEKLICKQKQNRAFPWNADGGGKVEWLEGMPAARLSGPLTLTYRYPVTNVYAKVGCWPYIHEKCPTANLGSVPTDSGISLSNPNRKSDRIKCCLPNFWSGVECPNCGQVQFPLIREASLGASDETEARIVPNLFWRGVDPVRFLSNEPATNSPPPKGSERVFFFYGGSHVVGDLKLEVELEVEQAGGALELEVGSNLHRASWVVSLGGPAPSLEADEKRHAVTAGNTVSPGGKHVLTLAYVDGSVLSSLDGSANEPVLVAVKPPDAAKVESLARLRLHGDARVKITRLELYRDLFYSITDDNALNPRGDSSSNDYTGRTFEKDKGRYELVIPADKFLALGDNAPSSVDSRFWGFVPRKNLVGRASFVFWPPSRWRLIR